MSRSILHEIGAMVQRNLEQRQQRVPWESLQQQLAGARTPQPFVPAFLTPGIHTLAEIKFKSPALGVLEQANAASAVDIAQAYLAGGTTAISVLTEPNYFHGHLDYLRAVRAAVPQALLLMKDFILEPYQIAEGLLAGADAILLIVSLLGRERTQSLLAYAQQLNLAVLVEVHDADELDIALALKANLIGINNRNLKTLDVNLQTSFDLIQPLDLSQYPNTAFISESGIQTAAEIRQLRAAGFSGFLIGSAFMSSPHPGRALATLIAESAS